MAGGEENTGFVGRYFFYILYAHLIYFIFFLLREEKIDLHSRIALTPLRS
jgi:hypothetical protein